MLANGILSFILSVVIVGLVDSLWLIFEIRCLFRVSELTKLLLEEF